MSVRRLEESGWTIVAKGSEFLTWNPIVNHENQAIESRRKTPVPTFELQEIVDLLSGMGTFSQSRSRGLGTTWRGSR
jgi:hypothetical protein